MFNLATINTQRRVMYTGYKVYGPYTGEDGRLRVVLYRSADKHRITVSYPKYLMEMSLGRKLDEDEQVHHKDENPGNNAMDNLEILKIGEHQLHHAADPNRLSPWDNCVAKYGYKGACEMNSSKMKGNKYATAHKGRKLTEEHKKKIADSIKAKYNKHTT